MRLEEKKNAENMRIMQKEIDAIKQGATYWLI